MISIGFARRHASAALALAVLLAAPAAAEEAGPTALQASPPGAAQPPRLPQVIYGLPPGPVPANPWPVAPPWPMQEIPAVVPVPIYVQPPVPAAPYYGPAAAPYYPWRPARITYRRHVSSAPPPAYRSDLVPAFRGNLVPAFSGGAVPRGGAARAPAPVAVTRASHGGGGRRR